MEKPRILSRLVLTLVLIGIVYLILRITLPAHAETPPTEPPAAPPIAESCEGMERDAELAYDDAVPFREAGIEWCINSYCMLVGETWNADTFPWKDSKRPPCFKSPLLYGFRIAADEEGEEPEIGVACQAPADPAGNPATVHLLFYSEKGSVLNGSFFIHPEDQGCLCDHNGCAPLGHRIASTHSPDESSPPKD